LSVQKAWQKWEKFVVACSPKAHAVFKKMQILLFFAGFGLSLIGSLPPGLISLTVAQSAIARGLAAGLAVAVGAAFVEFFQAWAAVSLTDWFLSNPAAEQAFQWAAMPVFFMLGIHLIFFSKPQMAVGPVEPVSLPRFFGKGMLVSTFNLLAVPYWFVYCAWLRVEGYWQTGWIAVFVFSFGVSCGAVCALGLYAWLGRVVVRRASDWARFANGFIGVIFLGLGLKLLWGLIGR